MNRSKVDIYFNLHKTTYSIKQRGKVILHSDEVYCGPSSFIVQPAGRERVVRERKKNVHAFVRTTYWTTKTTSKWFPELNWRRVTYNPYKGSTFMTLEQKPIHNAKQVKLVMVGQQPMIFALYEDEDNVV